MQSKQPTPSLREYLIHLVKSTNPKTVDHLIHQAQQKYPLPKQEILDHIINLQNQGKLALKTPPAATPPTLKHYLRSTQASWYWTITSLAALTTLLVFTIPENAYPLVYVRYVLGTLFVLGLPGYTLIKALFPTKTIDTIERIALSIGMSLALVPITGLLLNYTPWGIRLLPITLSLLALTLTLATTALLREYHLKNKAR